MNNSDLDPVVQMLGIKGPLEVVLKNGDILRGYSDCGLTLPIDDDGEEEDDFIRFLIPGEPSELIRVGTVKSFRRLNDLNEE